MYINNEETSIRNFYIKRCKAIFPSYWLAYSYFYINEVIRSKDFFIGKPKYNVLFSLVGMDGYFNGIFGLETNYFIGEWFLGAIIICYLLMPWIIRGSKKHDLIILAVLGILFLFDLKMSLSLGLGNISCISIITCLFSMQIGIVVIKRRIWLDRRFFYLSLLGIPIFQFVKVPINVIILSRMHGICIFIVVSYIGRKLMDSKRVVKIIEPLSKSSYSAFLLHHQIIVNWLSAFNSSNIVIYFMNFFMVNIITVFSAFGLDILTKAILDKKQRDIVI